MTMSDKSWHSFFFLTDLRVNIKLKLYFNDKFKKFLYIYIHRFKWMDKNYQIAKIKYLPHNLFLI